MILFVGMYKDNTFPAPMVHPILPKASYSAIFPLSLHLYLPVCRAPIRQAAA